MWVAKKRDVAIRVNGIGADARAFGEAVGLRVAWVRPAVDVGEVDQYLEGEEVVFEVVVWRQLVGALFVDA